MTAQQIIKKYISFFEKRGHKRIPNAPLVAQNDPTTLFTSSGMQPLVPYLLGEEHPMGKRLVNVQNCFRAQDIDEVGDNHHTTFFRMLGNWSLGGYFKELQLPWFFEFLIKQLNINPEKLYVSVFTGFEAIPQDVESERIWRSIFEKAGVDPKNRICFYDADKNWWSRAGGPKEMPEGEPGGPDSEVFYDFGEELGLHQNSSFKNGHCDLNCQCGRFMEIGNSVFMQYQKKANGSFKELPQRNVDFGGGLERLLAAVENQQDIFQTSLFSSIVQAIELQAKKDYKPNARAIRIITDHLIASVFIAANGIVPSNKEQGYVLRRLIRRAFDHLSALSKNAEVSKIIESIVGQYKDTDKILVDKFEEIKNAILEEMQKYKRSQTEAEKFLQKKYPLVGGELKGVKEISPDVAFIVYTTHGLSPTQIKSLGYTFNDQQFAEKMKSHQNISRAGATKKFAGGLADHSENTIRGHTATHLLHQALRDVLGNHVFQTGSNITSERVRFDFNFDRSLTVDELKKVEDTVNEKIKENLPVHFEMMPLKKAKEIGAIGLFDEKYANTVKIYFIGPKTKDSPRGEAGQRPYSIEFCGGPHVEKTSKVGKFSIIKQENIGQGKRRIYAKAESDSAKVD